MFKKILSRLGSQLDKNSIPYMIIGGQAVLIYGEPRFTKDIDITLGIGPEKYEKILGVIKKLKLKVLISNIDEFVHKTMVLPAMDEKSGIRLDFIFSNSNYEKKQLKRPKKYFLVRQK